MDELINGKPKDNIESIYTINEFSESSVHSNGPLTSSGLGKSRRRSKSANATKANPSAASGSKTNGIVKKYISTHSNGPLTSSGLGKSRRRSKSANATKANPSAASGSKTNGIVKKYISTNQHVSRSKIRTRAIRFQTMGVDRSVMNPVTPKIQMNAPFSMLRYPKMGETIISMAGSPIIANGRAMHNTANINIPMANGVFSMNPTPFSEVDSNIVPRIDGDTLAQLKQLQDNLGLIMSTVSNWSKN